MGKHSKTSVADYVQYQKTIDLMSERVNEVSESLGRFVSGVPDIEVPFLVYAMEALAESIKDAMDDGTRHVYDLLRCSVRTESGVMRIPEGVWKRSNGHGDSHKEGSGDVDSGTDVET